MSIFALSNMMFLITSLLRINGNIAILISIFFAERTFFSSNDGFVIIILCAVIPKNGNIERRAFPAISTLSPVF
jgi:hypothetical protein